MKRHLMLAALILAAIAVSREAGAQDRPLDAAQAARGKRGLVWDNRPSIVLGEDINIDIRGRAQLDLRRFDPDIGEDGLELRTARFGVKGDLTRHFDYEVERGIEDDGRFGEWKDVYLNWSTFDAFSIKGGRFKMPFGLEQNTGATDVDFAYRSLASQTIAPGRDRGVMAYGDLGRATYEVGIFDDDGDNGEVSRLYLEDGGELRDVGPSYAVRIVGDLLRLVPSGRLRSANIGIAYTQSQIPEGLNSLRGRSVWGTADFFEPVYVDGRRRRLGLEFDWTPGPAGLKAEWMQSREQRLGQSNRNEDLSDLVGTGWYVSGTWLVTGENKGRDVNIRRPLFGGGFGAVELAARLESLSFVSADTADRGFTNPRSEHLLRNTDRVWTFGVNWFPVRWVRVIANGVHETFEDAPRTPIPGTTGFWSGLLRLQVVF